ncbi:PqqD family protein [Solimonas sp. SE-A11]|uniref:PqqD family protein n=1 Tax=Solimonas sp. SE-A11 TaxID=3054954 RepID=UPI00259C92EA|nr:PqqD family protein [Solimonas sp. SE-A11]MDM4772318.1 PqqD family protein [Solimonas sp. SE-A11]
MQTDQMRVARAAKALGARINDEVVILQVDRGTYLKLNSHASAIWDLLEEPTTLGQLCERLQERYAVAPETCRADVVEVLEQMRLESVVETGT